MRTKYALRFLALGYLVLLLGIPVALVFVNASRTASPPRGTRSPRPRRSTPSG